MSNTTKTDKSKEDVDPEMLKNLDVLMDMDLFQAEKDWDQMEENDSVEVKNE